MCDALAGDGRRMTERDARPLARLVLGTNPTLGRCAGYPSNSSGRRDAVTLHAGA